MLFVRVPDQKRLKNRLHLDLRAADYNEAVARALALGASAADDIYISERWKGTKRSRRQRVLHPAAEADDLGRPDGWPLWRDAGRIQTHSG